MTATTTTTTPATTAIVIIIVVITIMVIVIGFSHAYAGGKRTKTCTANRLFDKTAYVYRYI